MSNFDGAQWRSLGATITATALVGTGTVIRRQTLSLDHDADDLPTAEDVELAAGCTLEVRGVTEAGEVGVGCRLGKFDKAREEG